MLREPLLAICMVARQHSHRYTGGHSDRAAAAEVTVRDRSRRCSIEHTASYSARRLLGTRSATWSPLGRHGAIFRRADAEDLQLPRSVAPW